MDFVDRVVRDEATDLPSELRFGDLSVDVLSFQFSECLLGLLVGRRLRRREEVRQPEGSEGRILPLGSLRGSDALRTITQSRPTPDSASSATTTARLPSTGRAISSKTGKTGAPLATAEYASRPT
jgi:hypothetical protein